MTTQQQPTAPRDPAKQFLEWSHKHRRKLMTAAAVLIAASATAWFVVEYQQRKEVAAEQALDQARAAIQSGNFPLAISDLSRLISSYGGTVAADEAVILRAQVRLIQDQEAEAALELQAAIDQGLDVQFLAPAYGLLGVSLETIGNMTEAGEAYVQAAETSWYGFLAAQYLNDAGRAFWAARDTLRAAHAYERVLQEFQDAPGAVEARVRLTELRTSKGVPKS